MIGPLIGAAGTIAGGLIGAGAERDAANRQWQIDMLNYYAEQARQFKADQQAQRTERDSKLGSRDSRGNTAKFIEGIGWVSELGELDSILQELYNREEKDSLTDLQRKRGVVNENIERQGRENLVGESLLDAFQRVTRGEDTHIEDLMNEGSVKAINEAFDSTLSDAFRNSVRTGASNSGKVAAEIARSKSSKLEDAFRENKLNSRGQAGDEYDTARGNLANLYNMFATRASAVPDASFNPRNIEGLVGQQQAGAAASGANAQRALLQAFMQPAAKLNARIEPQYGLANTITQGAQALAGAFDRGSARRERASSYEDYGGYSGLSDMFRGNSGAW